MRSVLALLCAVVAVLLAGCGGGSSSSTPTRASSPPASAQSTTSSQTAPGTTGGTAPPPPTTTPAPSAARPSPATTPQARRFREQAVAVCGSSHVINVRIRTARNYARLALPLLVRTRRNLQRLRPPRAYAQAVQSLVTSLGEVIDLYGRVTSASSQPDPGLRSAAVQATRRLASLATGTGLGTCGPPVGRR